MQGRPSSGTKAASLPPNLDLWEPVPFTDLPPDLVSAFERQDWPALKEELATVMDSVTTDGIYGRELLQLVRSVPLGVDRLFNRYRAAADIDYGDWDDLRLCLATNPVGAEELEGLRDIWLAPLDRAAPPQVEASHVAFWFAFVEMEHQRAYGPIRRWAKQMPRHTFTNIVWSRNDIPATRHFLYRRLADVVFLAIGEAHGGRLPVAEALARESQSVGYEREPLRFVGHDLEALVRTARGLSPRVDLEFPGFLARPTGASPGGAWQVTTHLLPFLTLTEDGSFEWCVRLVERVAGRMASPRALFHAQSWRVAGEILAGHSPSGAELAGLIARSRSAAIGLRALPQLLHGWVSHRYPDFADALRVARQAGNVWVQVAALAWMTAIDPTPSVTRSLFRLLEVSGWRRLVFVPPQVAADAALALSSSFHGNSVLELALLAGRSTVTVEIANKYLEDSATPSSVRLRSVEMLGKLGTVRSREILQRLSRRKDDVSELSASLLSRRAPSLALSDREAEVLDLVARGLTNREIGKRLDLSEYTVARHIANARAKLGAANRAEAVSRLRGTAD